MVKPIPEGMSAVTPFIMVKNVDKTIEFCQKAFDAQIRGIVKNADGTVMHCQLTIGGAALMFGEQMDGYPAHPGCTYLYLSDPDAAFKKAIANGGIVLYEPKDEFYGDRCGGLRDGQGNVWFTAKHIEDVAPDEINRRAANFDKTKTKAA